jgi:hypothetical protein
MCRNSGLQRIKNRDFLEFSCFLLSYARTKALSARQKPHRPLEPDKTREIRGRETLKNMLNTLVEVAATLLHSQFFYDIIISGRVLGGLSPPTKPDYIQPL